LRDLYRKSNPSSDGILSIQALKNIFTKINLTAEDKYINALINKLDKKGDF
jgi:Ca2+-binding EF-hand superfamily protein